VRVVARPATAALVRYDDEVLGRRPDVATLHVPRLPEPGYAEEAIAERRDLAPLVSAYLGPVEPGPGLAEAIERLASRRDVFVEPGRLARVMAARSQLPRGTLIQLLPQPLARTDLGLALLGVERAPADVAGRLTGLEGSAAGAALAWNLAQASLSAVRIAASITPQRDAADDPRRAVLLEAARLADASATLGAPPDAVRRLRAAIEGRAGNEDEVLRLLDR
jgi:hypothetical protein